MYQVLCSFRHFINMINSVAHVVHTEIFRQRACTFCLKRTRLRLSVQKSLQVFLGSSVYLWTMAANIKLILSLVWRFLKNPLNLLIWPLKVQIHQNKANPPWKALDLRNKTVLCLQTLTFKRTLEFLPLVLNLDLLYFLSSDKRGGNRSHMNTYLIPLWALLLELFYKEQYGTEQNKKKTNNPHCKNLAVAASFWGVAVLVSVGVLYWIKYRTILHFQSPLSKYSPFWHNFNLIKMYHEENNQCPKD